MFLDYLKLYFSFIFLFVLPGFSFIYWLFKSKAKIKITQLEYFVLSGSASIVLVILATIILDRFGIPLNQENIGTTFIMLISLPLVLSTFPSWKVFIPNTKIQETKKKANTEKAAETEQIVKTSNSNRARKHKIPEFLKLRRRQLLNSIILIFLSFFIAAGFLKTDVVPNNTDLGHHVYFAELIKKEQRLPEYDTSDVVIGEHIGMANLSIVSGVSLLSALPTIFLMLITAFGFLAVYILTLRIFKSQLIAWTAFSFTGILYVVAAPMMKFASGGVVGNVTGNLFIPSILLLIYLTIITKRSDILALTIFLFSGLFYIHHLSAFLLMFIIAAFIIFYLGLNVKNLKNISKDWFKIFLGVYPVLAIFLFTGFLLFVYTPGYIEKDAVQTVVQAPQKDTHQGVSVASFVSSIGEWRALLGFLGLSVYLILSIKNEKCKKPGFVILLSWVFILMLLSFYPGIVKVDLPSRRVVNYLVAPLSMAAAYFVVTYFSFLRNRLSLKLFSTIFLVSVFAVCLNGFSDSLKYFLPEKQYQFKDTVQLYHAARYLESKTETKDTILKDHANLTADTWLKFFFLRGYDYILSRTFDYKYEDNPDREQCTYEMAIAPDSQDGQTCFKETGTDFVILRNKVDNFFFNLSDNFEKIYENDAVVVFRKS